MIHQINGSNNLNIFQHEPASVRFSYNFSVYNISSNDLSILPSKLKAFKEIEWNFFA